MACVRNSIKDPLRYGVSNIRGLIVLLECSKDSIVKSFIFGSSSSVYGASEKVPFNESSNHADRPISPYAATKRAGELICHSYHNLYRMNIICLRFFTVYGPRGRPDMAPYKFTDLIYNEKPIERYGDGSTERDYTFISDIADGIIACIGKELGYEIFNLGNSETVRLDRLIGIIEKTLGKKAKIVERPIPAGDVLKTYADISKAKKIQGYVPKTGIEESMKIFIEWYLKNRAFGSTKKSKSI